MAHHVRRQIRDAVFALLDGESAPPWTTLQSSRRWQWQQEELPGVAIYTDDEAIETVTKDRLQERSVGLVIECAAAGEQEGLDDTLDAMQQAVEEAFGLDPTLAGLSEDIELTRATTSTSTEGEKPIGRRLLLYTVITNTREGAPSASLV